MAVTTASHLLCKGQTGKGRDIGFLITNIANKDDWASVTADVYLMSDGKTRLLCEEAWYAGRSGAQIDDKLSLDGDLYIECLKDDTNVVTYALELDAASEQEYKARFKVQNGKAVLGVKAGQEATEIQCTKI